MEADRMVNSFIKKEDLESEMTVVRNEFESGENRPSSVLMKRVMSTAYMWHNYGNTTIGARADIENVPIERLQAFYRKYYQPDNAYLVVAGKIDPMETLGMIKEYFGRIPKPERELIPTYTREPVQDGERFAELRRVGDVQVVSAAYHICPGSHSDYAPVSVLVELLTSEPSGRLYEALVESGKASSQWGWAASLREPGFAYFSADVLKENSLAEAEAAMKSTIDDLRENPPTEEEVERARKRILKNLEQYFRNSASLGRGLSEYIAQGDWRLAFLYRDRVEQVTPEQVQAVAQKYFKPSNRTVGRFFPDSAPDRVEVPDRPDIASMLKNYEGKEAMAEGEAFDPSPENIEARTSRDEWPTIEYALLPKETRGNSVNLRMSLRFGSKDALKNKQMAASFAGSMLNKGTAKYSRQEIEDKLDELKATIYIGGGSTGAYALVETENDKLPEVIDLVGEMFSNPTFPEEEFEKLKSERLASIEESRSEPMSIASQEMQRRMSNHPKDDPRYTMTFDEELEAINALTLDEVKAFYESFYGATDATVAIVGDFDAEETEAALERNFKSWKSPAPYKRLKDEYYEPKPDNVEIETPDKANAMFLAGQSLNLNTDDKDYPALLLGNFMLGGGFLNSRLATRIRQEEGLSYGVGSFLNVDSRDRNSMWQAYAIYAPENVEALEKAFKEEIEKVRKDGFTEEEIEAAKSGWIQSQSVNRSQDRSLAGKLNSYLDLDRTLEWDAELEAAVMALTPEQINKAMAKYLDPDKMVLVKAGDFAKSRTSKP
jgi:zinc protease